jgi:tRNA (cytidine/uridine-2'-O-)-methyltransferase
VKVVLVEPENPYNTGAIARTCALTGASLHLVHPFGFAVGKDVRRASMSYLDDTDVSVHASLDAFTSALPEHAVVACFSERGRTSFTEFAYGDDPWLLFGSESAGLPPLPYPSVHVPMPGVRQGRGDHRTHSLNVAACVAVAVFEVLRQRSARAPGPH